MTDPSEDETAGPLIARRGLLTGSALGAAALGVPGLAAMSAEAKEAGQQPNRDPRGAATLDIVVNGRAHRLAVDPRATLLDTLREALGLTGSKKGCDHGQCGACTVHVGGRRVLSCLTLALSVREPVTSIEGLADPRGALLPMQQAFIDQDAFQCGYCTPGQIMSALGCIAEGRAGSEAEIRESMSGNLCRCAAYPHIVAAVRQARGSIPIQPAPRS